MGIMFSSLQRVRRWARELLRIPSTSKLAFLPNDVIFDILSRVPVKSLCRFQCVSRGWRAIISDPIFLIAQQSRPAEQLLVVGSFSDSCLRLIDMDAGSVVRVVNYTGYGWTPVCMSPTDDILCVTGYSMGAPAIGMIDLTTMKVLVTHPGTDRAWGCGRAVPSGAYKVVRFGFRCCEVFTLGDGEGWRSRKSFPFRRDFNSRDNYTSPVNGILHFLAVALEDAPGSILRFDLETEEWKSKIKGPPNVKLGRPEISLGELNGALCMVEPGVRYADTGYTNIWLLTDSDKSLWIKAYRIPLDPSSYHQMMPLRVLQGGWKLLFRYNKLRGSPVLRIYDHYHGTCTDAMNKVLGDHVSGIGFCSLHLEGLISSKIPYPKSCERYI